MLELTILLLAGLILAVLFVWWAVKLWAREIEALPAQVGELLQLVPLSGISYDRVEQLFDATDYRYLDRLRLHDAARRLERDRRQVALLWLRLMHEDFDKLQQFRRILMTCGVRTSPRAEWTLLMNSLSFRLLHGLFAVWIRLLGLYATPRAHTALVGSARAVSSQVAAFLARLSPGQLAEVKQRWSLRGEST